MSNTVNIELPDGTTVEVDSAVLIGYRDECFEFLREEADQKRNFKDAIEAQAETLGIDKKYLGKWIKQAFKAKTKETSALGELFSALDEAATQENSQD